MARASATPLLVRRVALALIALAACLLARGSGVAEARGVRRWSSAIPVGGDGAPASGRTSDGVVLLAPPEADAVLIRGGTFEMGSPETEVAVAVELCRAAPDPDGCREEEFSDELAAHPVELPPYWIDRTEVTVARYERCVAAGRCSPAPLAAGGERFRQPDYPITMVTWYDAAVFCAWAGGRLPTEAEWERAARGVTGRRFPWGNVYNPFLANHGKGSDLPESVLSGWDALDARDGFLELAPVGSFARGRTPDGIADLAGNADEWVADWYAPEHPAASAVSPQGPATGEHRVVRGGSYVHGAAWLRGAGRGHALPASRRPWRGFRCARDA